MKVTTSNITEGCVGFFPYIMDTISWNMFSVVEGASGRNDREAEMYNIGVGAVRERGLFPT